MGWAEQIPKIAAAATLVALAALPTASRERERNMDPAALASPTNPVLLLKLSDELLEWGRRAADPVALIVSANLLARVAVQEVRRDKEARGEADDNKANRPIPNVAGILAEARELAGTDPALLSWID